MASTPKPTKAERREQAREQARELREKQLKREKRNKVIGISSVAAAVVVLVLVGVMIVRQANAPGLAYTGDDADTLTLSDVTAPSTAGDNGSIPVGAGGAAGESPADGDVIVSIYTDFMCPYCGQFEQANDEALASLRAAGGVTVEYHMLAFMDSQSQGTEYSTRAGNAAALVADQAPEKFTAFYAALFANQPAEGSTGLSDSEIADLASEVGVPDKVIDQFTATNDDGSRTFAPFLKANNNTASKTLDGVSTPTVLINGEKFTGNLYTAGDLTTAVQEAMGSTTSGGTAG